MVLRICINVSRGRKQQIHNQQHGSYDMMARKKHDSDTLMNLPKVVNPVIQRQQTREDQQKKRPHPCKQRQNMACSTKPDIPRSLRLWPSVKNTTRLDRAYRFGVQNGVMTVPSLQVLRDIYGQGCLPQYRITVTFSSVIIPPAIISSINGMMALIFSSLSTTSTTSGRSADKSSSCWVW